MPDQIDWDKPLQTRGGSEVRIWTRDANCDGEYPIYGEVKNSDDSWSQEEWMEDGTYSKLDLGGTNSYDLVNAPEKKVFERYFKIENDDAWQWYSNKEDAMHYCRPGETILHVRIEYEPGVHQLGDE
jgi:hypothetical protein